MEINMLGAIIGDIAGSRFEFNNNRSKDFTFLTYTCKPTDDSIMTLAIAKSILEAKSDYSNLGELAVRNMQLLGRQYPNSGYGGLFYSWLKLESPMPYNSYGNGAAMRVSPCGLAANSINEAKQLSKLVTEVTHNHPEGIKGAEATAVAIYLAKSGKSQIEIRDYINDNYYPLKFKLDDIRNNYEFNETCQGSVPQAITAFLEATDYEDAIRNAISIGGDSDTLAAITGSIAEAYWGIPADIRNHALTYLDDTQLKIVNLFENKYGIYLMKDSNDKNAGSKKLVSKSKKSQSKKSTTRQLELIDAIDATEFTNSQDLVEYQSLKAQKLYGLLYEACNILRGPINQDNFKSYVIPFLFYKRICDVYEEETIQAQQDYGDAFSDFDDDEIHKFIIPEDCKWSTLRNQSENIGSFIANAMNGIERANPETLSGLFSSFDDANWSDKSKLDDARLKNLVEHFSSFKVGNKNYTADIMGDAYEFLLKKFADISKKNAGEFYTPRAIVKLLIMLLNPQEGDSVYDPACGTGGMLIEAIRHMQNSKQTYGKIYGQEKNLSTSAIARMNLYLHGAADFKITQGDTLLNPNYIKSNQLQTFDCVVANPPFGLDNWGASAFECDCYGRNFWGCPSDSNADFAWLQHMVKSMNPKTGRCAVIFPQGVLFHTGKEGEIRKKLVESDKLEAVITLVGGIFYNAGVSACILYMNNNKPENHKGKIALIDASEIYTPQRAQKYMSEENIQNTFKLYTDYADVIEKSKIVTIEEVAAKDYSLSVNNYIEKKQIETIDPKIIKEQYLQAYNEVIEAENKFKELLAKEGLL